MIKVTNESEINILRKHCQDLTDKLIRLTARERLREHHSKKRSISQTDSDKCGLVDSRFSMGILSSENKDQSNV